MIAMALRVFVGTQLLGAAHAASGNEKAKVVGDLTCDIGDLACADQTSKLPNAMRGSVMLQSKTTLQLREDEHDVQGNAYIRAEQIQLPTTVAYEEGRISNADYDTRISFNTAQQVQETCSNDSHCKGYWQRVDGSYRILKPGSRTWSKSVPNDSVASVKVRKAPTPAPSPQQPAPDRCKFSEENKHLFIPTTLEQYDTIDEAKSACNANPDCGGVTLYLGNYEVRKGPGLQPSGYGASSWVCEPKPSTPSPEPPAQPSPQPSPRPSGDGRCKFSEEKQHVYIPATIGKHASLEQAKKACDSDENCGGVTLFNGNFETRQGGAGPCLVSSSASASSWVCERSFTRPAARPGRGPDVPDSVTCSSRTRDTTTVAPEEWQYFLAYQEDRRKGFSSPCKPEWADCGKGLGHMESGNCVSNVKGRNCWEPNPEKVVFDCKMWVAAYRHAEDQAIKGYFSHFGQGPRTSERERSVRVGAQSRGEHQAGRGSSWSGALRGLQSSPGHSNSMFQPKRKGIAVAHGKPGIRNIWTVLYNFGGDMIEDSESCIPDGFTATGDRKSAVWPAVASLEMSK